MRRLSLALLLALAGIVVALSPAQALSCVGPEGVLDDADLVFTGTIIGHDENGSKSAEPGGGRYRILIDVDEVWSGPAVHDRIWLETELDIWWDSSGLPNEGSSATWLFAPHTKRNGAQVVNPCTAWNSTEPWGTKDLRPATTTLSIEDQEAAEAATDVDQAGPLADDTATATPPTLPDPDEEDTIAWTLAGVGAVGAALLVAIVVRGRRTRRT